ncbi:MAG TPA: PIN domain-containing protein [Streptosporangiaceae bacterium]|nr:PIN domain-containing protein [Streptosporangiaceae bacterium]
MFLAWVKDEPGRANHIEVLMDEASAGQLEIITSVLSITEVSLAASAKDPAALDAEVLRKIDALWQPPSPVKLAEFYRLVAADARDLMRKAAELQRSLKPPDAIHLSTAARTQCDEILSYDDLSAFAPLVNIPVREPDSGTLPFDTSA